MRRAVALVLVSLLALSTPVPAWAYLKYGVQVGDRVVDVRWNQMPVRYLVNERGVDGVSGDQFREAIGRAFGTWAAVPGVDVSGEFLGVTEAAPSQADGWTTLGFLDRPDLDRVLAATSFILDASTGEIVDADIFFNTRFDWSTAPDGAPERIDVESIALHEIGHLLGLGHSAIGETELGAGGARRVLGSGAVMFPIAYGPGTIAGRTLLPDDIAGITDLYHVGDLPGSISGRVTKDGRGVYGAHVMAFDLETGTAVGGFAASSSGSFVIGGLAPGMYLLRAEPLDDADPESFLTGFVDVDFAVTYAPRLVVVPRRGRAENVEIAVRSR